MYVLSTFAANEEEIIIPLSCYRFHCKLAYFVGKAMILNLYFHFILLHIICVYTSMFPALSLVVQQALVKPSVNGLEDDDTEPPGEEPVNLDYSSPWHDDFVANKEEIRSNLHILHPSMQTVLHMCQNTLGNMLLIDCSMYR